MSRDISSVPRRLKFKFNNNPTKLYYLNPFYSAQKNSYHQPTYKNSLLEKGHNNFANPTTLLRSDKAKTSFTYFSPSYLLKEKVEKPSEYELQLGKTIDGIRQDFNSFLDEGLANQDIYSESISLIEPYHSGLKIKGKKFYIMLSKLTRTTLLWYYQDVTLNVTHFQIKYSGDIDSIDTDKDFFTKHTNLTNEFKLKTISNQEQIRFASTLNFFTTSRKEDSEFNKSKDITSKSYSNPPLLYVRFLLEGTPRPALMLPSNTEPRQTYHGVFIYQFNDQGKVQLHRVQKIYPSPTKLNALFPRLAWWWWLRGSKPEYNLT